MTKITQRIEQLLFLPLGLCVAAVLMVGASTAIASNTAPSGANGTQPVPRISAEISSSQMTVLPGTKRPIGAAEQDNGRLAAGTRLEGISLYFKLSPSQKADLQALMAAQLNPNSPLYHQWLTPQQFGARFGMADSDIAKVEGWLERQGFTIDSVSNGKTMIRFSGTVGQVEAAFATEIHTYSAKGETHFAPSVALSVPTALAGVFGEVRNLDSFRPKSHLVVRRQNGGRPTPKFTGSDGSLFFAPGDVAVEYDIQKAYNAGFTGAGQQITIVGQSFIDKSDIENFEAASLLPTKDPELYLVPGTGSSTTLADGDETESDLDVEWSGAIAKGATVNFVYTGSNENYSVFDALQYAIDNKIGNVISSSYGTCEAELPGTELGDGEDTETALETAFQQAATQGQTVLSAAGDDGATDCFGYTNLSISQQDALAVDYPGSSAYVLSVGGTEISQANENYLLPGEGYWESTNTSTDEVTSVLQYIPEQSWNEDSAGCGQTDCLAAGGGGASSIFVKPSWQTALSPADGHRDVPDVSLNASINYPGYLFCTSDTSDWSQGQQASCNDGFRDLATGDPTWAGGTSFAAPIFAGMIAIINQQQGYTTGQGLVNKTLYSLAGTGSYGSAYSNPSSAFHDIVVGNNDCPGATGECSSPVTGYAAQAGYDLVTGLGTVDFYNLASAWPASTAPTLIDTTTTVTPSNAAPTVNTSDTFTIAVTSDTGTTVPSGTVNVTVDTGTPVTETLTSNGTYSYQYTFTTAGSHTVQVSYSGDSTHASSTASTTVTVGGTTSGGGTFALKATDVTVKQGSTGTSTITVTPTGGYTGTVDLSFDTSNDTALTNLCYSFTNSLSNGDGTATVTGASAVTTQLSLDTNAADCSSAVAVRKTGKHSFRSVHSSGTALKGNGTGGSGGGKTAPAAIAFAGLLMAGLLGRKSRKLRNLAGVIALLAAGLAVSACGGSNGNSTTISDPPKGTYTITLSGQDSSTATITATTTFTFTID